MTNHSEQEGYGHNSLFESLLRRSSCSLLTQQCLLLGLILTGILNPVPVLAVAPTVTNNSITLATGAKKNVYLYTSTIWTGNTSWLTYTIVDNPQRGTLTFPYLNYGYTSCCQYQSDQSGYVGTDSFTWCASTGSEVSAVATYTIKIITNSVPVAKSLSSTVPSGISVMLNLPFYTTHASADSGQMMTYMICSQPSHGTVYVDNANGGYAYYTSSPGFVGRDTFTWAVSDGLSTSAPATVTILVGCTPPVVANQTAIAVKNTPLVIHPRYTGGGGYTCSVVKVGGPSHGTLTPTNGTWFYYKPASNYFGSDSFTWKIAYSNATIPATNTAAATCSIAVRDADASADWTQWRFDECRSAQSPAVLPDQLYLQWRRDLPTCPSSFASLQGIDNCRPVQLGKTLFVSLMANDSVTAYDTDTGAQKWRYYTSGALRRPPCAVALSNGTNVVIVGCDDGYIYCLNAADGSEVWKFRAAPNAKKAMGCGRLGSAWPLWGSPVAYGGKVYVGAGLVPSFGTYIYCLDAATGAVVWRNDGRMLRAKSGASTLGPLALSSDRKRVYGTAATCDIWTLDAGTGEKIKYDTLWGYAPPMWFIDGSGKSQWGEPPMEITAGGQTFTPQSAAAFGVSGAAVGSMLAGDGKLFVSTIDGRLYCFGCNQVTPTIYTNNVIPLPDVNDGWSNVVQRMLSRPDLGQGLALVWGVGSGRLVEEMAKQAPGLMIVAADPDPVKLRALRVKMDAAGLSGARVSTLQGNPMECGFAPYQAALIVSEDVSVAGYSNGLAMVKMLYECTRPFGGEIWLPTMNAQHTTIAGWVGAATNMPLCEVARQTGFTGIGVDGFTQIKRTGLPDEKLVFKPPFGLTAFGTSGSLYTYIPPSKGAVSGKDVYSWLPVTAPMPGYEFVPTNNNTRPPGDNWTFPMPATMLNPLYSTIEKGISVGLQGSCSGIKQYGNLRLHLGKITSLGDQSEYWGTTCFPEIGGCCGPAGVVGDGIINLDGNAGYHYCNSYSFQGTQIGLTPMEDGEECWVNYRYDRSRQAIQEMPVRRVGVNFGALGDVYLPDEKILWTHHPYSGRSSEAPPLIPVSYRGNVKNVYHHSAQMERRGDRYHGWVSASQVTGMDGLTAHLATPLVALRTTTTPVADGQLNDGCWDGQGMVSFPSTITGCYDPCYVMLRYDDTNLYIGSGVRGDPNGSALTVLLNNREQSAIPLTFQTTNIWKNGLSGTNQLRTAELVIPWTVLEAAGLWKEQLIMSVNVLGNCLYGTPFVTLYGPVYLDTTRGSAVQVKPHTVRLYFAEMEDKTAGQRVFDVKVQGQTVLTNFDVVSQAGGPRREVVKEFKNVGIAGDLVIDFTRKSGEPMVSGVEIIGTYSDSDFTNVMPVAVIEATALSGPAPLDVMLSARRSHDPDGQIVECAWETGDGRLARGSLIRHVFAEPGMYKVNLFVLDNRGGTGVTNVIVTVGTGVPSSFVCKIRSSGGDYTDLVKWEAALESDLTSSSTIFKVSSLGTYVSGDNGQSVVFSGGTKGLLRWITTNQTPMIAAVANVGGTGTVTVGTVRIANGHTFTISDTGVAARSLLFTVPGIGNYVPGTDDGKTVTFTGGGVGILKHINGSNIAYISECRGSIQAGTVTCASGHTFSITDAGSPIYTVVAECYNDWTNGLKGAVTVAGWIADENHCVTIRPAAGQGHKGQLRDAGNKYTGFTMAPGILLDASGTAYTRIERIALDGGTLKIGATGSLNRVCANVSASGSRATIANSVGATFSSSSDDVGFYNCTGKGFTIASGGRQRYLNCLSVPGGSGFTNWGTLLFYRSHCVSSDGTATNLYLSEQALDGNLAGQAVTFMDAAKGDYHLAVTDTGARGLGVPGLGADIDGDERIGPCYDVGADQTFGNHAPRITGSPAATPSFVATGAVVRFTVAAADLDDDAMTYEWRFGDGDGTYGTNVTHVYAATGTYTARVAVSDGSLTTTGSVIVSVLNSFDLWLVDHFGSTNAPTGRPSDDADHDGMSNVEEFLAGTDPMDPRSALVLTDIKPEPMGGRMVLQWRSESNKWYWIGKSANLMTGFLPVISNIPATYPLNTCTVDVGSAQDGFFVIKIEK